MGVMTRQTPAREIAPGLCVLGLLGRLAARLAQGFRKLPGQVLQARRQGGRSLWTVRTVGRWLDHSTELTQTTFVPKIQAAVAIAAQAIKPPAISPPSAH